MAKQKHEVTVNRELAAKILGLVDQGLCSGLGKPIPGQMCIEAAVNYAMGLPHGDEPPCVSRAVRALKIRLNDASWSSNEARAKGMRRLAIAQLGTAGILDDKDFSKRVTLMLIQKIVPRALRHAACVHPHQEHRDKLEEAAKKCEACSDLNAAAAARWAAAAAARDSELSFFAEEVVKILIDMKAQGTEWLDLTEAA